MNSNSGRHVAHTRIMLRPVGSGLPLGFFSFAVGMLLLACQAIGWIPVGEQRDVAMILMAFVFPLELVACIFAFDAQYLEATAAASAKLYARIERLRNTGGGGLLRTPKRAGRSLPMPPYLGGLGPIAWRQLSTEIFELLENIDLKSASLAGVR